MCAAYVADKIQTTRPHPYPGGNLTFPNTK